MDGDLVFSDKEKRFLTAHIGDKTDVVIPASTQQIEKNAFIGETLNSITCLATIPPNMQHFIWKYEQENMFSASARRVSHIVSYGKRVAKFLQRVPCFDRWFDKNLDRRRNSNVLQSARSKGATEQTRDGASTKKEKAIGAVTLAIPHSTIEQETNTHRGGYLLLSLICAVLHCTLILIDIHPNFKPESVDYYSVHKDWCDFNIQPMTEEMLAVESIACEDATSTKTCFDLQGRKVTKPQRGQLYLQDGKKAIVW